MVEMTKSLVKDLGLQREVFEALPYAVVGGAWENSFDAIMTGTEYYAALRHIVPTGLQLKVLFLRIWTQEASGARFSIYQTNPAETGQTGDVEAYPVVGSVPPGSPPAALAVTAVRDYPMLEAAGAEVLTGSLVDPVHVLEGSIEFRVLAQLPGSPDGVDIGATGARYGITWWGVQKNPEG